MEKKCIVFDLDGTILDTKLDLLYALNSTFAKYGVKEINEKELIKHLGRGLRVLFDETLSIELDSDIKNEMFNAFKTAYNNHSTVFTIPYPGVKETLLKLKKMGIKLAVVSNKVDEYATKIVQYYYCDIFDFVTGSRDNLPKKPDPDLVYLALEKLHSTKEESYYVGDSIYDFLTAINSSIDPIILSYGYGDLNKIKEKGAKIIIDNFKDILKFFEEDK